MGELEKILDELNAISESIKSIELKVNKMGIDIEQVVQTCTPTTLSTDDYE